MEEEPSAAQAAATAAAQAPTPAEVAMEGRVLGTLNQLVREELFRLRQQLNEAQQAAADAKAAAAAELAEAQQAAASANTAAAAAVHAATHPAPAPPPLPPSTSKATPSKPNKYAGETGRADQWCFEMEQYFKACRIEDPTRVPYAGAMLTGNAAIWWRSVAEDNVNPIRLWDQFKADLIFNFKHYDNTKAARLRLRVLHQRTSVATYYAEFTKAILQIPDG